MPPDRSEARGWWLFWRTTLLGAVLVAILTAPTLTHPTTAGRLDTDDGRFSIWNVAWIDHALLTDPGSLLDANIMWPHKGTLAYSELNLVAGILGLPWYAVTGSALAALNGAVATALLLCFVVMWALVRRLSGSDGAGLVAATAFTFCPYMTARTAHVQLLMIFAFPLVMLAYHRLAERPNVWRGVELGAALAVAALACGYYGIFAGCSLAALALVLAKRDKAYWVGLGIAVLAGAAFLYPVFRLFAAARVASGSTFLRRAVQSDGYSANWSSYLASSAVAHDWWLPALARWQQWEDVLFPGMAVIALAVVGLVEVWRGIRPRVVVGYVVMAAVACWASFGPRAGLYWLLQQGVPGMTLLRAPSRFGVVATFALAVVAGFGVARLERRRRWLPAVLVLLVACELSVRTPEHGWPSWPLRDLPPVPAAYSKLAGLPRAPLVEFPFPYTPNTFHTHGWPMFWSTYHWQPMVNGYSDVTPPDMYEIALPINAFPDAASFAIMKARDVRYVLWRLEDYDEAGRQVITQRLRDYEAYLRPLLRGPDIWLYQITRWP
ncbi:MAG: hypothetical protein ABI051_08400 [Vicinamibacterales bacterium]